MQGFFPNSLGKIFKLLKILISSKHFLILTSLVELSQQISIEYQYRNAMSLPRRTRISVAT